MLSLVSDAMELLEFLNKATFISNISSLDMDMSSSISNTTVRFWRIRESTGCTKWIGLYSLPNCNFCCSWRKTLSKMNHWFDLGGHFWCTCDRVKSKHPQITSSFLYPPFGRLYGKGKMSMQKSFLMKTQRLTTK